MEYPGKTKNGAIMDKYYNSIQTDLIVRMHQDKLLQTPLNWKLITSFA